MLWKNEIAVIKIGVSFIEAFLECSSKDRSDIEELITLINRPSTSDTDKDMSFITIDNILWPEEVEL